MTYGRGGEFAAPPVPPPNAAQAPRRRPLRAAEPPPHGTDVAQEKAVEGYEETHGRPANPKELEAELAKVSPPLREEIEDLAALGAPEGEEARVEAIVSGLRKALKQTEAEPSTLLSFDEGFFIAPGELAGAYGFEDWPNHSDRDR